jgi:hypothetical protein
MRTLNLVCLLCLYLLSHTNSLLAATYYVATTGDNDANSCTMAQSSSTPKRTINAGLECVGFGAEGGADHIVEVAAGTYDESIQSIPQGKSWTSPFLLRAKPGASVTVQWTRQDGYADLYLNQANYTIIDGIAFDGSAMIGSQSAVVLYSGVTHMRLQNLEIKNVPDGNGLLVFGSYNEFINLDVHDTNNANSCEGGNCGHAFYIAGHHNLIERSSIHDNGGWGIHNYNEGSSAVSNNTYRNNRIYRNGLNTSRYGRPVGPGIGLYSGTGNKAYNNIIWDNQGGVQINYGGVNSEVYNNTIYRNAGENNDWECVGIYSVSGTVVKNNICYQNGPAIVDQGSGSSISNNLTTEDPRFVNEAGLDFHLLPDSPAIDAGTDLSASGVTTDFDGVSRPQRSAYDIGAYEFTVDAVVWTNLWHTTATGNSLQKTSGSDGGQDGGAISQQQIISGNGYVEFTAGEATTNRGAGLGSGDNFASLAYIEFAIFLWIGDGHAYAYEGGTPKADMGAYATGDVFRVSAEGGVIKYYLNGILRYTSLVTPTYPLLVNASLWTLGSTINNAMIVRTP